MLLMFNLLIALVALDSVANLARLFQPELDPANYTKLTNPILLLVAIAHLLRRRRIRLSRLSVVAMILIPIGAVVGVVQGGEVRFFVSHLFSGVFIALLLIAGLNVDFSDAWLARWLARFSAIAVASYALVLTAYWWLVVGAGQNLYVGVGSSALVLPFAYYATHRRRLLVLLAAVLVVASGARGAMVAIVFVAIALWSSRATKTLHANLALTGIVLVVVATAGLVITARLDAADLPPVLRAVVAKAETANPLRSDFELGPGTSGRADELDLAFRRFSENDWAWFTGLGYGWSFYHGGLILGTSEDVLYRHYVHVSPADFVLLYGLPLSAWFFWLLFRDLGSAYRVSAASTDLERARRALLFGVMGALVNGIFSYTYATDPSIWVMLGLLTRVSDEPDCVGRSRQP